MKDTEHNHNMAEKTEAFMPEEKSHGQPSGSEWGMLEVQHDVEEQLKRPAATHFRLRS